MILRCRSAVLCDEVRTEDNGKALHIGVYGKILLAGQKPAMLPLNIALAFDTDTDQTAIEFRVTTLSTHQGALTLVGSEGYTALLIPIQIALTEPRTMTVEYRNPGAEWIVAGSWELRFAENASPAPPEFAAQITAIADSLKKAGASAD